MTYQEMYDMVVEMAKDSYDKLGWREQSPMIFLFKEQGKTEVFIVPHLSDDRQEAMNMLAHLHKSMARMGAAVLMIEAWVRTDFTDEELKLHREGMSLESDPKREEAIMVNIRHRNEQRIGLIKLNREHQRMTASELRNPLDGENVASGRFVG